MGSWSEWSLALRPPTPLPKPQFPHLGWWAWWCGRVGRDPSGGASLLPLLGRVVSTACCPHPAGHYSTPVLGGHGQTWPPRSPCAATPHPISRPLTPGAHPVWPALLDHKPLQTQSGGFSGLSPKFLVPSPPHPRLPPSQLPSQTTSPHPQPAPAWPAPSPCIPASPWGSLPEDWHHCPPQNPESPPLLYPKDSVLSA